MTTITGADTYLTQVATLNRTKWESIINQGIDKINGYANEDIIPNMTGNIGSKSLEVPSYQAGFIRSLAIAIYNKEILHEGGQSSSEGTGNLSHSGTSYDVESLAKDAAKTLRDTMDVSRG